MDDATLQARVTLSTHTIHNPTEARHFMRLRPVQGRVRVLYDGLVVAESERAIRLLEVAKDFYDPTIYINAADVLGRLRKADKKSFCPLKGNASYYDLLSASGETLVAEIAWTYDEPITIAEQLRELVSFYHHLVVVEEHPI